MSTTLLCLPPAGAGTGRFRTWSRSAPPWLDVRPVRLPGRESRFRERAYRSMGEAVRELTPLVGEIDGRLAVFGHSMGGLIGFELTRALEGCGRSVDHLFLSCCAPRGDQRLRAGVDDDVLYARLGIDAKAIPASLRSLTSATLRADLELCETFRPDGAVRAPVTVVVATADPLVPPGHAARWRAHAAGPLVFVPVTGGHDLLASVPHELLEIVTGALAPEGRP